MAESVVEIAARLQGVTGQNRIAILHEMSEVLLERRDSNALKYDIEALQLGRKFGGASLLTKCLNHRAHSLIELSRYEEAMPFLKEAENYFSRSIKDREKAITYWRFGNAYHKAANYDMAEFYMNMSLELVHRLQEAELEADISADLASNYRFQGTYDRATEQYIDALRYYESQKDSVRIMDMRAEMGIIHFLQSEPEKALKIFLLNRDYRFRQNDSLQMGLACTMLALAYYSKGEFDASIEYSEQSIEIRKRIDDIPGLGESYNNLALAYMGKHDWETASEALEGALDYLERGNDLRQIPVILINIGDTRWKLGKYDEALSYYVKAQEKARETGHKHSLANSYLRISLLYRSQKEHEKAFNSYRSYASLKDSLFNEEKTKIINDLNLQYQTEEQEREIEELRRDKILESRRMLVLGVGLVLVIIISVLALNLQRTRIRKNKMLHEKEKQIIMAREALTDSELRNTRNELSYNKRMLVTYMENILRKNALVEQLEAQVTGLELSADNSDPERDKKVKRLLEMKILTNDDWQEFKRHFDQVHLGLLGRLQKQYPDMTRGENRLFILLKLKLSSKEISNILGVSLDTVKKSRYRLRKKLKLEGGKNIQKFVDEFD